MYDQRPTVKVFKLLETRGGKRYQYATAATAEGAALLAEEAKRLGLVVVVVPVQVPTY